MTSDLIVKSSPWLYTSCKKYNGEKGGPLGICCHLLHFHPHPFQHLHPQQLQVHSFVFVSFFKMHSAVGVWSHLINANGVLELLMSGAVLVLLLFEICEPDVIVFVDSEPMGKLMCLYLVSRAYIILKPDFPFPLAYYLIPFTGVVGMIILVMVIILVSGHSATPFQLCVCVCVCERERGREGQTVAGVGPLITDKSILIQLLSLP